MSENLLKLFFGSLSAFFTLLGLVNAYEAEYLSAKDSLGFENINRANVLYDFFNNNMIGIAVLTIAIYLVISAIYGFHKQGKLAKR